MNESRIHDDLVKPISFWSPVLVTQPWDSDLDSLRIARQAVKVISMAIWMIIVLVVIGPALGYLVPSIGSTHVIGSGVDTRTIAPQLQSIFSNPNVVGTYTIVVPVYDRWIFPANASLSLKLIADGQLLYQTQAATIQLPPFQSGQLLVIMQITPALAQQIQGRHLKVGGQLYFGAPAELWSSTINFGGG